MTDRPLYEDEQLRIDYNPMSGMDHILYVKDECGEDLQYLIHRGILKQLATTPRGGIESVLDNYNPQILMHIQMEGISVDGLHIAICQAYAQEEERISRHIAESEI